MIVGAELFVTLDGGRSWRRQPVGARQDRDAHSHSFQRYVQILPDGTILHAFEGRANKIFPDGTTEIMRPFPVNLGGYPGIRFRDGLFGIAVGFWHSGATMTTDGGRSWDRIPLETQQGMVTAVWVSPEEVYVLNERELWRSVDTGRGWQLVAEFVPWALQMRAYDGFLWIVGGNQIWRYDLATSSMTSIESDFSEGTELIDIGFREDKILALSTDGKLYIGAEDGDWEKVVISKGAESVLSFDFAADGTAFAVGGEIPITALGSRAVWTSSDLRDWSRVDFPW